MTACACVYQVAAHLMPERGLRCGAGFYGREVFPDSGCAFIKQVNEALSVLRRGWDVEHLIFDYFIDYLLT